MSTSVTMPALGESVSEGTVTRWLKQEGDQVQADEPLLEVSTDKVDTEIPAPASGVLTKIVVAEDETVAVGTELAVIGDAAEGGGDSQQRPAEDQQPEQQAQQAEAPAEQRPTEEAEQREQQPTEQAGQQEQPAAEQASQQGEQDGGDPAGGSGDAGGSTSVKMAPMGESVTEGTVTRWLKQEGDQVQADEALLEVSTDKVDTEIPAPASGVLTKIVVGEDETVAVGTELAVIGGSGGGSGEAAAPQQAAPQQAAPQQTTPAPSLISAPAPQQAPAPAPQAAQPD